MPDRCWPNWETCEIHRPSRRPAAEVPGSIRCVTTPGCVLMHGHRGDCEAPARPEETE